VSEDRAARIEEVLDLQSAMVRVMHAGSTEEWLQLELTLAQVKALFVLHDDSAQSRHVAPGLLTIGALAERLGVGVPTASHLVERLVQLGMVERREDETDRRRALVAPTPRATELVDRLRTLRIERMRRWLEKMDDQELRGCLTGLQGMLRVARER
jgi:DNA-binding MarR family transcriptional regulator